MKKGENVYLQPINNMLRRRYKRNDIILGTISSIGGKYISVNVNNSIYKFYIDTLRQATEYSEDFILYKSKQELLDEIEYEDLFSKIHFSFDFYKKQKYTLEQLRKILKIIDEV